MIRLAVFRFRLVPKSPETIISLALLCSLLLAAACSGAKQPDSSAPSSSSSSATSSAGSFEGVIGMNLSADAQPMEMKYFIKGPRSRIETNLSRGSQQMGAMLMDFSSGTYTMLMPQAKTYMTMSLGGAGDRMMGEAGDAKLPRITSTGKTETIAGYACEHWLIGDDQKTDICFAKGLGYFGAGGQLDNVLGRLKDLPFREKMKAQLEANPEFARFVEGGAFPLKISQIEGGQAKTIMEVTNVERKSLDESLFAVPADYKKMEIPGMPAGKK